MVAAVFFLGNIAGERLCIRTVFSGDQTVLAVPFIEEPMLLSWVSAGIGVGNLSADGVIFLAGEIVHAPASGGVLEAFQEQRMAKQGAVRRLVRRGEVHPGKIQIDVGRLGISHIANQAAGGGGVCLIVRGCHICQLKLHMAADGANQQGRRYPVAGGGREDPDAVERHTLDVQPGGFLVGFALLDGTNHIIPHQCAAAAQAAHRTL